MLGADHILNLLAQDSGQYEASTLGLIAFVPLLIAVILFWLGVKGHHAGKPAWIKWISLVPLAIGLIIGIAPMQKFYGDPLYKEYYGGTWKKGALHASGVILPIVGAIGLAVWNKWLTRQKFDEL